MGTPFDKILSQKGYTHREQLLIATLIADSSLPVYITQVPPKDSPQGKALLLQAKNHGEQKRMAWEYTHE